MARRAPSSKNTKSAASPASSDAAPRSKPAAAAKAADAPTGVTATKKAPAAHKPSAHASDAQAAPAPAPAKKAPTASAATGNGQATGTVVPAAVKGAKDGISWTKDFDFKFLAAQRATLLRERDELVGQASRLEDEANSLIEEHEMGDVQFDEESGEGDTMAVERERDLALSSQARQTVAEIEAALERIAIGTYGYSVVSGTPIPRDRLEAIPWATELVQEKVGGLGRR